MSSASCCWGQLDSGLDHTKLLYFHNGQEERITDTKPCRVVKEILENA